VTQLTALKSLSLEGTEYSGDGLAPLAALTSLRHLRVWNHRGGDMIPACLSALTWLEQLKVGADDYSNNEEIHGVLSSLQRLTCLSLDSFWYHYDGVLHSPHIVHHGIPPVLAELHGLQRLCFSGRLESELGPRARIVLPQGPWLASIRWLGLGLPLAVLDVSAALLRHAPRLEYLCVVDLPIWPWPSTNHPAFDNTIFPADHPLWELAATHPPLRCLALTVPEHALTAFTTEPAHAGAIAALRARRPALRLRYLPPLPAFITELLEAETIPE